MGAETMGRVPPYSADAEVAIIGSILLNNQVLYLIQSTLSADDFFVEAHRKIYGVMEDLAKQNTPIDHVTVGHALQQRGQLENIGGVMALDAFTTRIASTFNVESYARIVRQKAAVRRMIYAASQVVAEGYADHEDSEAYLDASEKAIFKASQNRIQEAYLPMTDVLHTTWTDLEDAAKRTGDVTGVPTGFPALDRITAGFQPTDLIIVAGRPAMGKTALAINMAVHGTRATGLPTLIFSLEMSKEQLVRRMLSADGRVDASKMRIPNKLNVDDWRNLNKAAAELYELPVYFDTSTQVTPLEIRSKARRLKADKGLGLVVIDYLQLMTTGTGRRKESREQEVSEISRSLKGLAKELGIPVIALSQLNRGLESRTDKRPMMSDLRESGSIEQDSDLIMFVYRDEVYHKETEDKNVAEIIISKQRSGPVGVVKLLFSGEFTRFDNLFQDYADDQLK